MKKLLITLSILAFAFTAQAWEVRWDDLPDEDGYRLSYKPYPEGYSYDNQAPLALKNDMTDSIVINLPADTVSWPLVESLFVKGGRYTFAIQATKEGSVSGYSWVSWTYPLDTQHIELSPEDGPIQINIYQGTLP